MTVTFLTVSVKNAITVITKEIGIQTTTKNLKTIMGKINRNDNLDFINPIPKLRFRQAWNFIHN